jgi:lipopolysaccharide transport system ATP-binding protein
MRDSHIEKNYEWRDRASVFTVENDEHESFVGTNWLDVNGNISRNGKSVEQFSIGPSSVL